MLRTFKRIGAIALGTQAVVSLVNLYMFRSEGTYRPTADHTHPHI